MGIMLLYDAFQSVMASDPTFAHFSIDDVDHAFNMFVPLKFLQSFRLTGNGEGIKITAMNAGNLIGGTVWKISRESDDIFFCIDYNHKLERHLNGLYMETVFRPSLLIADCLNFNVHHAPQQAREAMLIQEVMGCLADGGEVLMPTDASGRSLELLLILHSHWTKNNLVGKYSLVFLSRTAKHTIDFANSMLEWMSDDCQKQFNKTKHCPFNFECLRICTKKSDLDIIPKPRVILATNPFMENGFSQEVFFALSPLKKNLLLLTERAPPYTVAGKLFEDPSVASIDYKVNEVEPLKGEELSEYIQFKREADAEINTATETHVDSAEEVIVMDDDIVFNEEGHKKRIKKRKITQLYPMFPCRENRVESDEYGDAVNYRELFRDSDDEPENDVLIVEFSKKGKRFIKRDERNRVIEALKTAVVKKPGEDKAPFGTSRAGEDFVVPTKTVTRLLTVEVKCAVKYIDFEGKSDGASIFNIISSISPRKLILLHGSAENAAAMRRRLERVCGSISCPKISRKVDVTSQSAFFKAVLTPELTNSLKFSRPLLGHKVADLRATICGKSELSGLALLCAPQRDDTGEDEERNLFLGNPKLIDVNKSLQDNRIEAELSKGIIVCGEERSKMTIRKLTSDCIYISGNISKDYYRMRKALYDLFEVV